MDNLTSNNNPNFYWWFGVVEDRNDPLRLGRCRVRILGYHNADLDILPTEDLPWALPIMPANSAGTSGVGWSPTGAVEGSWVVGFFADGENGQHPMFFGTVGSIPGGLRPNDCSPEEGSGSSGDSATTDSEGTPSNADGGQPVDSGPPNQEFWTLVAICYAEAGGNAQNQCDVAQSIYNRVISGRYGGNSILSVIFARGQYQPVWYYPERRGKEPPSSQRVPNNFWRNITDANSAARAVGGGATPSLMLQTARNLKNTALQENSRSFIGSRTDFRGNPYKNAVANSVDRTGTGSTNAFGFNKRGNYRGERGVAQIPSIVSNQALA